MTTIEILSELRSNYNCFDEQEEPVYRALSEAIKAVSAQSEVIRCKDCKHRPVADNDWQDGFDIEFPDNRCPCQCDDGYYNWLPDGDWFCGNAERRTDG